MWRILHKGYPLSLFTKGRWAEVCDKRHVRPLTRRFVTISSVVISWFFLMGKLLRPKPYDPIVNPLKVVKWDELV